MAVSGSPATPTRAATASCGHATGSRVGAIAPAPGTAMLRAATAGGMPMTTADRTARKAYAAGQWVDLRDRLQTVTPQAIGRAIVAVAATAGCGRADRRLVAGGRCRSSSAASSPTSCCPWSTPSTG